MNCAKKLSTELNPSDIRSVARARDGAHRFQGVDLGHRLVRAQTDDARKAKRVSRGMAVRPLHVVEGDLDDLCRFDRAIPSEIANGVLEKPLRHLRDLLVR